MLKGITGDEGLEPSPFYKETKRLSKQRMKNRFFSYKLGLLIHDLILVLLVFGLVGCRTNFNFNMEENVNQILILFTLSLVVISFFSTFNLYSYHVIFLKRKHVERLAKSFGWSFFTLGTITAIFMLPQFFLTQYSMKV